jgi:hypothetical protein
MLTSMVSGPENLNLDIDVRIGLDAWIALWSCSRGWNENDHDLIAALLRYAYGAGYVAALTEPHRGQLMSDHGLVVPLRATNSD